MTARKKELQASIAHLSQELHLRWIILSQPYTAATVYPILLIPLPCVNCKSHAILLRKCLAADISSGPSTYHPRALTTVSSVLPHVLHLPKPRGVYQDRLLRDAVFARAEEEERSAWRSVDGASTIRIGLWS